MIARTAGPCVGDCGGRIHPGDQIEGVPGEGWRHIECGHVDRGQETIDLDPKTACPDCHLIHAGSVSDADPSREPSPLPGRLEADQRAHPVRDVTDTRIRLLFTPEQLAGMGRCPTCGWHPPTQNHDPRCPEHQPTETKGA